MPSNSLFDTLNPSGSMGVGERCAPNKKVQKTSFAQPRYVAAKKPSSRVSASNPQVHSNVSSTFQKQDANPPEHWLPAQLSARQPIVLGVVLLYYWPRWFRWNSR